MVDGQHFIFISSCDTMKAPTQAFPILGLTVFFRSFVDRHKCMDPPNHLVSCLLTIFIRTASLMYRKGEVRFSQPHSLNCNSDSRVYPMKPFQRMFKVGLNSRVFVLNR